MHFLNMPKVRNTSYNHGYSGNYYLSVYLQVIIHNFLKELQAGYKEKIPA